MNSRKEILFAARQNLSVGERVSRLSEPRERLACQRYNKRKDLDTDSCCKARPRQEEQEQEEEQTCCTGCGKPFPVQQRPHKRRGIHYKHCPECRLRPIVRARAGGAATAAKLSGRPNPRSKETQRRFELIYQQRAVNRFLNHQLPKLPPAKGTRRSNDELLTEGVAGSIISQPSFQLGSRNLYCELDCLPDISVELRLNSHGYLRNCVLDFLTVFQTQDDKIAYRIDVDQQYFIRGLFSKAEDQKQYEKAGALALDLLYKTYLEPLWDIVSGSESHYVLVNGYSLKHKYQLAGEVKECWQVKQLYETEHKNQC
jgi:hypothetical protein